MSFYPDWYTRLTAAGWTPCIHPSGLLAVQFGAAVVAAVDDDPASVMVGTDAHGYALTDADDVPAKVDAIIWALALPQDDAE